MFQPETEDMLPRTAPKPSACLTDAAPRIQPTVPEVSILFGQPNPPITANNPQQQQQSQPPQSYASWKKKVLPKVTYPAAAAATTHSDAGSSPSTATAPAEYATTARSSVYPLRTITSAPSLESLNYQRSMEAIQSHHQVVFAAPSSTQQPQLHDMNPSAMMYPMSVQRRSLEAAYARQQADVLTICAGTQTEPMLHDGVVAQQQQQQFATKQDVQRLQDTLNAMHEMQLRLLQMCEALLIPQQRAITAEDKATQCNFAVPHTGMSIGNSPNCPRMEIATGATNTDSPQRNYPQFKASPAAFLTPRATKPQAQSTTYRPNTPARVSSPKTVGPQPLQQQNLPKAATEKSLVMNELALKYLPNDKLNELLNELNISPRGPSPQPRLQHQQQLLQDAVAEGGTANSNNDKENVDKGPSDISNASYKYLKKYRLLPEEGNEYEQNGPTSPLLPRKPSDPQYQLSRTPGQMLNLEHIRNQPKFL